MDFKIDTKDTFSVITPLSDNLDANVAELLSAYCIQTRLNGSNNLIIDLQNIHTATNEAIELLVTLHESSYSNDNSLVFTGIQPGMWTALKNTESDLLLNIAPKMIEAVDMISMEILERDLLGEE